MKTALHIDDELLVRAKDASARHARGIVTGRSALVRNVSTLSSRLRRSESGSPTATVIACPSGANSMKGLLMIATAGNSTLRVAIVRDPSNLFVVLIEAPPAAG